MDTYTKENRNLSLAIDWQGCLQQCNNSQAMLDEMLSLFVDDLIKAQKIISTAYAKRDMKTLRAELHRCLGGVLYLTLPDLEQSLKTFQHSVRIADTEEGQGHVPELDVKHTVLQHSISVILQELRK